MKELRYTLLTDGSSDRALLPIISWLLRQHCPEFAIQAEWADLYRLPEKPKQLADRIKCSIELYPCDVLFVHRDAEKVEWKQRIKEIKNALNGIDHPPTVCVVPVRMTEAWLLHDEKAIRQAAGNPNGKQPLQLPPAASVERLPDPKEVLRDLLLLASGPTIRRRKPDISGFAIRIAGLTDSFEPLRQLTAFSQFENELVATATGQKWKS